MLMNYKVLLNSPKLSNRDNKTVNNALLMISLDNVMTRGANLEAIIHKINKTFLHCDIMLCDTLNRFNIMAIDDISEYEAYKVALERGNDWLRENEQILKDLSINHRVIRWDEWLKNVNFKSKLNIVQQEFNNNPTYKKALYDTAYQYLSRRKIHASPFASSNLEQCIKYLQEECAVMLLWGDNGYQYELYTAKRNFAMDATYNIFIKGGVMSPVIVDVKSKVKRSQEIINYAVNQFINLNYGHVYIKDNDGYYLFCNLAQINALGIDKEQIIGKTDYDFFTESQANKYREVDLLVIHSKNVHVVEETWEYSNDRKIFSSMKYPILDDKNKVVGVLGVSVDITAEKEAERLKGENEKQKLQLEANQEFAKCLEEMQHLIQHYKINNLNKQLKYHSIDNVSELTLFKKDIKLTKREREIIYFLSLNKSPKDIATILSVIENKPLAASTISSIIDKQLYPKFNVSSVGQLIEVANTLKLIPFTLNNG